MPLVLQISFYAITMQIGRKPVQKGGFIQNGFFWSLAGGCPMVKATCFFIRARRQLC